eukprot:6892289-Prymnesium_polylepis.1
MLVNRTWGPPQLEDVWLGSLLHRFFGKAPLTLATMGQDYAFNGGWHTGKGMEFNTTILYHNKHELPLIRGHVESSHSTGHPTLQCSENQALLPIMRQEMNAFHLYYRDNSFDQHDWCSLVEVPHLLQPRLRYHDGRARINQPRQLTFEEARLVDDHFARTREAHAWYRGEGGYVDEIDAG